MSLWQNLLPPALGRRRPEAPVTRAMLDLDVGALLAPAAYPYPPHVRPIRPHVGRQVLPLGNVHHDRKLFPPHAIIGRTLAHVAWRGLPAAQRSATRDVSGQRVPAKIVRRRPWLLGGTRGDTTGGAGPAATTANGPCVGCDK